jgi:hypothetical protein
MPAGEGDAWPIAVATIGKDMGEEVGVADVAVLSGFAATSTASQKGRSSEEKRMRKGGTAGTTATGNEAVVVAEICSTSASAPTPTASKVSR